MLLNFLNLSVSLYLSLNLRLTNWNCFCHLFLYLRLSRWRTYLFHLFFLNTHIFRYFTYFWRLWGRFFIDSCYWRLYWSLWLFHLRLNPFFHGSMSNGWCFFLLSIALISAYFLGKLVSFVVAWMWFDNWLPSKKNGILFPPPSALDWRAKGIAGLLIPYFWFWAFSPTCCPSLMGWPLGSCFCGGLTALGFWEFGWWLLEGLRPEGVTADGWDGCPWIWFEGSRYGILTGVA